MPISQTHATNDLQAARLKKLIQASQALSQLESLEELLPQLLSLAQEVMNAEASSILLYNPEKNVLEFALAMNELVGNDGLEVLKDRIELPIGVGIAGWVGENKRSLNVKDAQGDLRLNKAADEALGFVTRCLLCVPVLHKEELLGVVQVLNAKDKACFDDSDQELLESFGYLAGVALMRSRLMEERLKQQRYEAQLEAAARIQAQFKPQHPEPCKGSRIWGYSAPAQFVGGDLYDIIPLEDESFVVYVADVSGKGLPAALIMAALWTHIRSCVNQNMEMDEILSRVNRSVHGILGREMFATIVMCRYWSEEGVCRYTVGGHMAPLLVSEQGVKHAPQLQGLPLGLVENASYRQEEIHLQFGQSLLLLTDGVTEARDKSGEFFDVEGVEEFLRTQAGPPWGSGLVGRVAKWRDGAAPNDDTTVVEIWREQEDAISRGWISPKEQPRGL
jgi:serine phosphatase RsbU (regulator of sigma subunit)